MDSTMGNRQKKARLELVDAPIIRKCGKTVLEARRISSQGFWNDEHKQFISDEYTQLKRIAEDEFITLTRR